MEKTRPFCFSMQLAFLFGSLVFFSRCKPPDPNFSKEDIFINERPKPNHPIMANSDTITLFLCGDVMTGRGVDQILPHPGDPALYEFYVKDARTYVKIAEEKNGKIPRKVGFDYIWGDALAIFEEYRPDVKLINLETSITTDDNFWKRKGINYRMHPENTPCLTAAGIDYCALANNHVLDWGYDGLRETLKTLKDHKISFSGAGENAAEASQPAILDFGKKEKVIVFAFGMPSGGVPSEWAAGRAAPGVNLLDSLSPQKLRELRTEIKRLKQPGDLLVASIHWGSNWGYDIPEHHKNLAHQLIDEAGFDVIHGHSSHHFMGIDVYKGKPVLYGCGDFITDYEGIHGHDEYRNELTFMYFLKMDTKDGSLLEMRMVPMKMKKFRLQQASKEEVKWMKETLERECKKLGTRVAIAENGHLLVK